MLKYKNNVYKQTDSLKGNGNGMEMVFNGYSLTGFSITITKGTLKLIDTNSYGTAILFNAIIK